MAFKDKTKFGKTELDTISTLRKIWFSSVNTPVMLEKHTFPDLETYTQIKDEIRGYKVDEEGNPILLENGKKEGVLKTLDYEKEVKVQKIDSTHLSNEKDKLFREELLALCYKYFGENFEKV